MIRLGESSGAGRLPGRWLTPGADIAVSRCPPDMPLLPAALGDNGDRGKTAGQWHMRASGRGSATIHGVPAGVGVEPGRVDVAGDRDLAALVGGIDDAVERLGGVPVRGTAVTAPLIARVISSGQPRTAGARIRSVNTTQSEKVRAGRGFFAALDQSGGSTPKALAEYGIGRDRYSSDAEMFDLVHAMRTRVLTSPAFGGSRVLAAILFEQTMERDVADVPTARYLWDEKNVVPFLKVDKGLAPERDGVQLMKPIDTLDDL
ncbi:MAG: hypothetical protein ACLQFR_03130, partial [Streptosporangiaceae bacterium]